MEKQKAEIFRTDNGDIRVHQLKTWSEFWDALITDDLSKKKTFDVRKFDKDFKIGDYLLLQNYDQLNGVYLKDTVWKKITYILSDERFLPKDIVVLGIIDEAPIVKF